MHETTPAPAPPRRSDRSRWNWLVLVPLAVSLLVPAFNRDEPVVLGIPFFYWYQMVAIGVGVGATVVIFRAHDRRR